MQEQLADFIEQHQDRIIPLLEAMDAGLEPPPTALRAVFGNRDDFTRLRACHQARDIEDARLRRQAAVLYHLYLPHQIEPELEDEIAAAVARVAGVRTHWRGDFGAGPIGFDGLLGAFRSGRAVSPRVTAWAKWRELSEAAAAPLLETVALRNRAARGLGFDDHLAFALEQHEIDPNELSDILLAVERGTDAPFRALRNDQDRELATAFKTRAAGVHPWHHQHPLRLLPRAEEEAPLLTKEDQTAATAFFRQLQLTLPSTAVKSAPHRRVDADAHERWHGLVSAVQRHAGTVARQHTDPALPRILQRPLHPVLLQAVTTLLVDELVFPEAFATVLHLSSQKATALKVKLREHRRRNALVTARFALLVWRFARKLYRHPGEDLAAHFAAELQGTMFLDARDAAQSPLFALLPDFVAELPTALVELLGLLAAEQLRANLPPAPAGKGLLRDPDALRLVKDQILAFASARHWSDALILLTGRPLDAKSFLDSLR